MTFGYIFASNLCKFERSVSFSFVHASFYRLSQSPFLCSVRKTWKLLLCTHSLKSVLKANWLRVATFVYFVITANYKGNPSPCCNVMPRAPSLGRQVESVGRTATGGRVSDRTHARHSENYSANTNRGVNTSIYQAYQIWYFETKKTRSFSNNK